MERIPEPELMQGSEQATAYANADFSAPHDHFVALFAEKFGENVSGVVLDLGCGPGDICRRFANANPGCRLHAVDASEAMLTVGRRENRKLQLQNRIQYINSYLPAARLPLDSYDIIISNSLLHHLHRPETLWEGIKQFGREGTKVFIMDLIRPDTVHDARRLVETYATDEPEVLRDDFFNSLCAAYRPDEVARQLQCQGLHELQVDVVSDRHLIVYGSLCG